MGSRGDTDRGPVCADVAAAREAEGWSAERSAARMKCAIWVAAGMDDVTARVAVHAAANNDALTGAFYMNWWGIWN
jgi:hypothetical protein